MTSLRTISLWGWWEIACLLKEIPEEFREGPIKGTQGAAEFQLGELPLRGPRNNFGRKNIDFTSFTILYAYFSDMTESLMLLRPIECNKAFFCFFLRTADSYNLLVADHMIQTYFQSVVPEKSVVWYCLA